MNNNIILLYYYVNNIPIVLVYVYKDCFILFIYIDIYWLVVYLPLSKKMVMKVHGSSHHQPDVALKCFEWVNTWKHQNLVYHRSG